MPIIKLLLHNYYPGKYQFNLTAFGRQILHIKIAFFHLSVWFIGQCGWKFC